MSKRIYLSQKHNQRIKLLFYGFTKQKTKLKIQIYEQKEMLKLRKKFLSQLSGVCKVW